MNTDEFKPNVGQPMPSEHLSINFTDPGTAEHVVAELQINLENLYKQRAAIESQHELEVSSYAAIANDLLARIQMVEAALGTQQNSQPMNARGPLTR
jgi:hypothetical protein